VARLSVCAGAIVDDHALAEACDNACATTRPRGIGFAFRGKTEGTNRIGLADTTAKDVVGSDRKRMRGGEDADHLVVTIDDIVTIVNVGTT